MITFMLSRLFKKVVHHEYSHAEAAYFEALIKNAVPGQVIDLESSQLKLKFLNYLSFQDKYLFHGSNHKEIEEFTPRQQTLFNNDVVEAVFATAEPMWSLFYAVLHREKLVGSFRNACIVYKTNKFLYYSINESSYKTNPWIDGMVYILPRSVFRRVDLKKVHFDEWISVEPVQPLLRLMIDTNDFNPQQAVSIHPDHEPIAKTMILYKKRLKAGCDDGH